LSLAKGGKIFAEKLFQCAEVLSLTQGEKILTEKLLIQALIGFQGQTKIK
jgi:hypothetical protein